MPQAEWNALAQDMGRAMADGLNEAAKEREAEPPVAPPKHYAKFLDMPKEVWDQFVKEAGEQMIANLTAAAARFKAEQEAKPKYFARASQMADRMARAFVDAQQVIPLDPTKGK